MYAMNWMSVKLSQQRVRWCERMLKREIEYEMFVMLREV